MSIGGERHERLDAQRDERLGRWAEVESDSTSAGGGDTRERWLEAREEFYGDVGPIPCSRADRQLLADLKDRYRGERIFVLGNGPSLNDTPLHLLADDFTFATNRVYLLFDRITWRPTFYTTVDWRVTADCADEINSLTGMQFFFPERFRGVLREGDDVTWYWNGPSPDPAQKRFATDASLGIRGAGSVTGAAIQLAFHMGFDPIYLLGCDVSYSIPDTVVQEGPDRFGDGVGLYLTSTEDDDANHFDPRYFGKGRRWHDPNVKRMIEGFQQCRDGADAAGRLILNATVGGKLEVFERVKVRSLFRKPSRVASRSSPPAPRQGPAVPERDLVAASQLVAPLIDRDEPGLALDIGAGTGSGLLPLAAAGWEVRAFEPERATYDELVAALPPQWTVFVDPRAIGGLETSTPIYSGRRGGGSLIATSDGDEPVGTAVVVTPETALMPLGRRTPDIVLISAAGWEMEIVRAYPWDTPRPAVVVVDVDDDYSQRLGFRSRDIAKILDSHGYDVFSLENRQTGPDQAVQLIGDGLALVGSCTQLIAVERGRTTLAGLELCRRAILTGRREGPAAAALGLGPAGVQRDPDDSDAITLQAELDAIRASTSWRVGHGIVLTARGALRRTKKARAAAARLVGRVRSRDRVPT